MIKAKDLIRYKKEQDSIYKIAIKKTLNEIENQLIEEAKNQNSRLYFTKFAKEMTQLNSEYNKKFFDQIKEELINSGYSIRVGRAIHGTYLSIEF